MSIRLALPFPPSANRYWRSLISEGGRIVAPQELRRRKLSVRVVKSAEARQYVKDTVHVAAQSPQIRGLVSVAGHFYFPSRAGDLDNRVKQWLDGLKDGAFGDDSKVWELYLRRHLDPDNPRVETTVTPWKEPVGLFAAWEEARAQLRRAIDQAMAAGLGADQINELVAEELTTHA